jgi:RimJ/RimL family protein N-acetyltransferase
MFSSDRKVSKSYSAAARPGESTDRKWIGQDGTMLTALKLPRLVDGPLVLRPFTAGDAALVTEAGTDPLIPLVTTVPPAPADPAAVRGFIDRQLERATSGEGFSLAIAEADTDEGLGQIGLWPLSHGRASVGYWVAPAARGRGVAKHALRILSGWGLRLPSVHRLELYVEPWNEASWRAAEAADYIREGLLRSWQPVGDQRRDMYMYSRLPGDAAR